MKNETGERVPKAQCERTKKETHPPSLKIIYIFIYIC